MGRYQLVVPLKRPITSTNTKFYRLYSSNSHGATSLSLDTACDVNICSPTESVMAQSLKPTVHDEDGQTSQANLLARQLATEEDQHAHAVKEYVDSLAKLMRSGNASGFRHIQASILSWFEPLMKLIEAEQELVKMNIPGVGRQITGPIMLLLPIDKMCVITVNTALVHILRSSNSGVAVRVVALQIGQLLQLELNLLRATEGKKILSKWQREQIKLARGNERRVLALARKMSRLVSEDPWSTDVAVQVGSALLSMLVQTARNKNGFPVFTHSNDRIDEAFGGSAVHNVGSIQMEADMYMEMLDRDLKTLQPQFLPMVVPPKPWIVVNGHFKGGYYKLDSEFIRTSSKNHARSLLRAGINDVKDTLDYLGSISWRINKTIYQVAQEAYSKGELIGELPSKVNLDMPVVSDYLNEEGETDSWRYDKMVRLTNKTNYELHSLRCDIEIKLDIANKFLEDDLYFPCNIDFRGRVYPVPPNLNHLGSDLCRGLLLFSEPHALGESGLDWLKIHLCNLFGNNKISLSDRREWADENVMEIFDSAANPLGGNRWWATAESPFQALACCIEIKAAIESGHPASYKCALPVHQDGSCNGLQHYAALGRDSPGGLAVNLISGENDRPGDVYTAVLEIVNKKIKEDVERPDSSDLKKQQEKRFAQFLDGKVSRKVIKQTVMTSVYGVTFMGSRDQILARLLDIAKKDLDGAPLSPEVLKENQLAAGYLAKLTLASLGEMFKSADQIMKWLGDCASLVGKSVLIAYLLALSIF